MKKILVFTALLTGVALATEIGFLDSDGETVIVPGAAKQKAKHTATNWLYYASATNQVYSYYDYANTQKVTVVIHDGTTNTYYSLNQ